MRELISGYLVGHNFTHKVRSTPHPTGLSSLCSTERERRLLPTSIIVRVHHPPSPLSALLPPGLPLPSFPILQTRSPLLGAGGDLLTLLLPLQPRLVLLPQGRSQTRGQHHHLPPGMAAVHRHRMRLGGLRCWGWSLWPAAALVAAGLRRGAGGCFHAGGAQTHSCRRPASPLSIHRRAHAPFERSS